MIARLVEKDDQMRRDEELITQQFAQSKDSVIEMLLQRVTAINLEVPKVVI